MRIEPKSVSSCAVPLLALILLAAWNCKWDRTVGDDPVPPESTESPAQTYYEVGRIPRSQSLSEWFVSDCSNIFGFVVSSRFPIADSDPAQDWGLHLDHALRAYHSAFVRESSPDLVHTLGNLADFSFSVLAANAMVEAGLYAFVTQHLDQCLRSDLVGACCTPEVLSQLAITLGCASQNNPELSRHLCETGAISPLAKLARSPSSDCIRRSLFAIRWIISMHAPAASTFAYEHDGINVLKTVLESNPHRTLQIVELLSLANVAVPSDWCDDIASALTKVDDDFRPDAMRIASQLSRCGCQARFSGNSAVKSLLFGYVPEYDQKVDAFHHLPNNGTNPSEAVSVPCLGPA